MADYNSSYTGPQIDNAVGAGLAVRGVNGIVKSDGNGNISPAVAGVDYQIPDADAGQVGHVHGNIAHFTDAADGLLLKSFVADITPQQTGSGDPSASNIRTISGWMGTSIYHAGDFAIQFSAVEQGTLSGVTGATSSSTTRVRSGFVPISAGTYKLFAASGYLVSYRYYTAQDYTTYVRDASNITLQAGNIDFTVPAGYIRIVIGRSDDAALAPADIDLRKAVVCKTAVVEQAVSWQDAGTVYGGKFDAISGTLTVTHGYIASYGGQTLPGKWISDRAVYASGTTPPTGAQVVYELATPTTYALTPPTITPLQGVNNLWADCGDVDVQYYRDIMTRAEVQRMIDSAIYDAIGGSY